MPNDKNIRTNKKFFFKLKASSELLDHRFNDRLLLNLICNLGRSCSTTLIINVNIGIPVERISRLVGQERQHLQRNRKHNSRVLLGRYLSQRLQVPQLNSDRRLADNLSSLLQGSGCILLSLRCDHFSPRLTRRFSFSGHGSLQLNR